MTSPTAEAVFYAETLRPKVGNVYLSRDPRDKGRKVVVVSAHATKKAVRHIRGRFRDVLVECALCKVVGTTRTVKISFKGLATRWRLVDA